MKFRIHFSGQQKGWVIQYSVYFFLWKDIPMHVWFKKSEAEKALNTLLS